MRMINPLIKFNGGSPVAICNRCSVIMCKVSCSEEDGDDCKVISNTEFLTKIQIGDKPPLYCDGCRELLKYLPQ